MRDREAILEDLRADIGVLDRVLRSAVAQAQQAFGAGADARRFAGLVIGDDEPDWLLSRGLTDGVLNGPAGHDTVAWRGRRLSEIVQACELVPFDAAVLLMAVAPEVDLRYERVYAYLQDDVTRRWPTVGLALDLFAPDAASKLALRTRLRSDAPLCAHGLVELVADAQSTLPLLARAIRPIDGVVRFLLGEPAIDSWLIDCSRLVSDLTDAGRDAVLPESLGRRLRALGAQTAWHQRGPTVLLEGGDALEHRAAAVAIASGAKRPLLSVDLSSLPGDSLAAAARGLRRAALLHRAVVHVFAEAGAPERDLRPAGLLLDGTVPVVSSVELATSLRPSGSATVRVAMPDCDYERRLILWQRALRSDLDPPSVTEALAEPLARRYRLSPADIERAMATACGLARWRAVDQTPAKSPRVTGAELMEAARAATRGQLEGLARRIVPRRDRSELILPPDRLALLDAIRAHVEFAPVVQEQWRFARIMSRGAGIVALFSGPPGTGKTLAAEVLAGELGLDLYAIDLSQVVSKYIGETEKNLARVFDAAESSNAVLFFDEADALFGARSEVRDAHDRYANIEVGYLLQRMETYSGLAVLATNLQRNIDDAFLRRMRFVIAFPLPDEDCRRRIWETTWPDDAPAAGLDWTDLAARFDVSGATIRDAAVSAAFLAAADGRVATMTHVEEAMRREYTKLGRVPPELSRPMASAAMTRATGR